MIKLKQIMPRLLQKNVTRFLSTLSQILLKARGYDVLDVNLITSVDELIKKPLPKTFNEANTNLLKKYRPISVLFCFSKILGKITYNRISNHLNNNNFLFTNSLVLGKVILVATFLLN